MTTLYDFVADISGITDTGIINCVSAALTVGMVLVTLNFCIGIVTYIFKPKV